MGVVTNKYHALSIHVTIQFSAFYYAIHFTGAGVGHLLSELGGLDLTPTTWNPCKLVFDIYVGFHTYNCYMASSPLNLEGNIFSNQFQYRCLPLTSHGYKSPLC